MIIENAIQPVLRPAVRGPLSGPYGGDPILAQYPGAAAAYSLRDLSASTANVVKVRRSSDNAELDFTAVEVSDGTLLTWVGAGEDGFVTTWYDQSGNGNDATQATAASQPKIVDAGVLVTENGKAAIDFDGSDDFLVDADGFSTIGDFSIIIVAKEDVDGGVFYGNDSTNSSIIRPDNVFFGSALSFNNPDGQAQGLFTAIRNDGVNGFVALNGAIEGSGAIGSRDSGEPVFGANNTSTGYSGFFTGNIQEAIIYPSDQSANRVGIETNINNYYGIFP